MVSGINYANVIAKKCLLFVDCFLRTNSEDSKRQVRGIQPIIVCELNEIT